MRSLAVGLGMSTWCRGTDGPDCRPAQNPQILAEFAGFHVIEDLVFFSQPGVLPAKP
jgi:hypothetical protein